MQTIRVDAGGVEYTNPVTITETTGKNISADSLKLCLAPLGSSPSTWVTAVEDTPASNSQRIGKLLIDASVPDGIYTLYSQLGDTPEVIVRRHALVRVVSTLAGSGVTASSFHVVDNGDGTETLTYG